MASPMLLIISTQLLQQRHRIYYVPPNHMAPRCMATGFWAPSPTHGIARWPPQHPKPQTNPYNILRFLTPEKTRRKCVLLI